MNIDRDFIVMALTAAAKSAVKAALATVVTLYVSSAVERRSSGSNASYPDIRDPVTGLPVKES